MSGNTRILIVGAGPSGLALALTLLRNGVSVRIIEKHLTFQVGARGAGLQPRTLELYKFLGVLPDIMKASDFLMPMMNYASPDDGAPPKEIPFIEKLDDTPSCPYNNLRMLGQDFQEGILRDHILKDYNCQVELATELRSFEQDSDHVVAQLVKTNLNEGQEVTETAAFDWLIGADGARGVVRKQLGLSFLGESHPALSQVVGDIHVKKGLDRRFMPFWGSSAHKVCGLRPYEIPGDDRCNFLIGGKEVDIEKAASSRDELIKTIHDITGRRDLEFGDLICMNIWRPNIRMVNKFKEGRVFVVGDAAHVHSPTGGQGMNSGVQDSINLGWKLALVQRGLAPTDILDTYTQERLPVIASMLNKTTELFHITFNSTSDTDDWHRPYEFRQLGINYRGSPLVVDERHASKAGEVFDPYRSGEDGSVRAGDRAPDAPGLVQFTGTRETVTSMFEMYKPTCHTVLVFSHPRHDGRITEVVKVFSSYPKGTVKSVLIFPQPATSSASSVELFDLVLVDRDGFAYKHYAVTEEFMVVIVRPDGYIGALVGGAEGLKAYFKRIFIQ